MMNEKNSIKNLLSHVLSIRSQIAKSEKPIPYQESYLKILLAIEESLADAHSNIPRLRESAFGIFRMVDGLPTTPVEEELLLLVEEINDLLRLSKAALGS